ncbi:NADP-dependent alcohol dehydrogenase [Guyanagaster necrorhizus]|uniref:NADP-dependent alcohol dehydrogenase n=1 Tax=Guyanagaster necrorhizus TaxID=856835 RepID=A0A9P8AX35_9AGAR|nr:NADP-dependent alcohol dehydrogenase [Guyanagaster necrorhizus MCA 3950]KAG7451203.1 NADP-dependent alcohol dehydrogenase [Guyanagaster necrorhizus MCA 3950]
MVYEGKTFRGSVSGKIVESSFTREELSPGDVVVKVTHSGLCGTDLHYLNVDMVLGHEGVGIVQEVGPSCERLKVGDRVGWGYMHETCGCCRECQTGNEVFCQMKKCFGSANFDQGSLGELGIWKEDWLFKLPDALSSEKAAPLMCAGSTVFTPLIKYCKPTDRVGIVGIGGLGHLAIQFAAKMGCDVVVFSGTNSKREEALSLGTHEFYATKGIDDLSQIGLSKPINRLIVTTAGMVDYESYFGILAPKATVIPLTVTDPKYMMGVPYTPFAWKGIEVVGTVLAERVMHNDMLDFSARNNICPIIEKFPMTTEGITEAIERLGSGRLRYRGVLTNQ